MRVTTSAIFTRSFRSRRQVGLMTGMWERGGAWLMGHPSIYRAGRSAKNALSTGPPRCQVSRLYPVSAGKVSPDSTKLRRQSDDKSFMRLTASLLALAFLLTLSRAASQTAGATTSPGSAGQKANLPTEPVWETKLSSYDEATYAREVENMIAIFERETGK